MFKNQIAIKSPSLSNLKLWPQICASYSSVRRFAAWMTCSRLYRFFAYTLFPFESGSRQGSLPPSGCCHHCFKLIPQLHPCPYYLLWWWWKCEMIGSKSNSERCIISSAKQWSFIFRTCFETAFALPSEVSNRRWQVLFWQCARLIGVCRVGVFGFFLPPCNLQ